MPYIPLTIFLWLSAGDYGLWKWSLAGNHQVLAVVFGLALLPLTLAFLFFLIVTLWRLLSDLSRRPQRGSGGGRALPSERRALPSGRRVLRPPAVRVVPRRVRPKPAGAKAGAGSSDPRAGKLAA